MSTCQNQWLHSEWRLVVLTASSSRLHRLSQMVLNCKQRQCHQKQNGMSLIITTTICSYFHLLYPKGYKDDREICRAEGKMHITLWLGNRSWQPDLALIKLQQVTSAGWRTFETDWSGHLEEVRLTAPFFYCHSLCNCSKPH